VAFAAAGCAGKKTAPPTQSPWNANAAVRNAEQVVRSQIHPGAKACFMRALDSESTQAGRALILIRVAPSGDVDSAIVKQKDDRLSGGVAACILDVARLAKFDPPGPSGSLITVPFNFQAVHR
jgi:hypothetical protein